LATELVAHRPVAVYSSPYRRAVQTVEPTARRLGLSVTTVPPLREWDSGITPSDGWAERYTRSWHAPESAQPEGESLHQLGRRAVTALNGLRTTHPGGAVVVGSHGTFIVRALIGYGLQVDLEFWFKMPMPAVYQLQFPGDGSLPRATGPGLD
jgi:2,3-bisphosphoglycerate-dependent phosphoglycerate mutase